MLQQARAADAVSLNCRCRSESVDGVVLLADPSVIEQRLRIAWRPHRTQVYADCNPDAHGHRDVPSVAGADL